MERVNFLICEKENENGKSVVFIKPTHMLMFVLSESVNRTDDARERL